MENFDLETFYDSPPESGNLNSIGRGGFGVVTIWRKKPLAPKALPHSVAVKEMFHSVTSNMNGAILIEDDEETLLSLRHEHILRYWQIYKSKDTVMPHIVMDLCAGNLDDLLDLYQCSLEDLRFLGRQISSGLVYLHQNKVIHRNIKPQTILVESLQTRTTKIKIASFSLSRKMSDNMQTATIRGTPIYMAPEIVRPLINSMATAPYMGQKVDIFAAGVTFLKILNIEAHFSMKERSQDDFDVSAFLDGNAINDDSCISLLRAMIDWDPMKRISALEVFQHHFFQETRGNDILNESYAMKPEELHDIALEVISSTVLMKVQVQNVEQELFTENYCPRLKHYELQEEIGRGRFGIVSIYKLRRKPWFFWKGKISKSHEKIAVKAINRNGLDEFKELREVSNHMKLKDNNVITMFGYEHINGFIYIKMEAAQANLSKLKTTILQVERFLQFEAIYFALQIFRGLSYLHQQSIVHRDIKPLNILAQWNDDKASIPPLIYSITLKLCDFGHSRSAPDETVTMTAVGTLGYMAPEVAFSYGGSGHIHEDFRKSDVFSAGVVVFEMIFGKQPYTFQELCKQGETSLQLQRSYINEDFGSILNGMLMWKAKDRLDSSLAEHLLVKIVRAQATSAYMKRIYSKDGMTALDKAVQEGKYEETKWLVESGDDINKATYLGWTPLHFVCEGAQTAHYYIAKLLVKRGIEASGIVKGLRSSTTVSCLAGSIDSEVATINRATKSGSTPLHLASNSGSLEIVKLLINAGADINRADVRGNTPLQLATTGGFLDVVELLLSDNGRVDLKNHEEKSSSDAARK